MWLYSTNFFFSSFLHFAALLMMFGANNNYFSPYYYCCCDGFMIVNKYIKPLVSSSSTSSSTTATTTERTILFVSSTEKNDHSDNDSIPTMDWLTNGLEKEAAGKDDDEEEDINNNNTDMTKASAYYMEEHEGRSSDISGDIPIPTTGVSVSDEMSAVSRDRFYTELVTIEEGFANRGIHAAQIVTTSTSGSFEPIRYVIGLSKQQQLMTTTKDDDEGDNKDGDNDAEGNNNSKRQQQKHHNSYVMIDVPSYSTKLVQSIQKFVSKTGGSLDAILITSRDCIHYDDAPGVFTIRKADLQKWVDAFPNINVIGYRLDIPRDCRNLITQRLDGYGPFALDNTTTTTTTGNFTFVETGRPLTYDEWDYEVKQDVLAGKRTPPDDDDDDDDDDIDDETNNNGNDDGENENKNKNDDALYTPEAIREREKGKQVLAVYTPGRTYGSISYVFPDIKLCASGFTIPIEDSRPENRNFDGITDDRTGPAVDCRGYITTSRAGIKKQMESARTLIRNYVDRFTVLLPSSRCDPFYLDGSQKQRQQELLDIVNQYEKIGEIYEQLGIFDSGSGGN